MGERDRPHKVLNIYGEEAIETVENALGVAKGDGAETDAEAVRLISAVYAGHDPEYGPDGLLGELEAE